MLFGAQEHAANPGTIEWAFNCDFLNIREVRRFHEGLSYFYVTLGNDDMFLRHGYVK